jgi:hypothetical protein
MIAGFLLATILIGLLYILYHVSLKLIKIWKVSLEFHAENYGQGKPC